MGNFNRVVQAGLGNTLAERGRRAGVTVGMIALMVFGMGPTCYNENGAACSTAGVSCGSGTIQVCQDYCVSLSNSVGSLCQPYSTENCAAPVGSICNPALGLACVHGNKGWRCVSNVLGVPIPGAGDPCSVILPCAETTYCSADGVCRGFLPVNQPCNDKWLCDTGLVCDKGNVPAQYTAVYNGVCRKPCSATAAPTTCPCSHTNTGTAAVYSCNANNSCCVATNATCAGSGECCTSTDVCSTGGTRGGETIPGSECLNCVGDLNCFGQYGGSQTQRHHCVVDGDCCDGKSHCDTNGNCTCSDYTVSCTSDSACCGTLVCLTSTRQPGTPANPGTCQFADPTLTGSSGCFGYPKAPVSGGGNGSGTEGTDCLAHGNSDCAQGLLCLSTPGGNEYTHTCHNPNTPAAAGHYCAFFDSNNQPVVGACQNGSCLWDKTANDVKDFTCK